MNTRDIAICAGVVLYNPEDLNRVYECIGKLAQQVDKVYIFDNSTKTHEVVFQTLPVYYMSEYENKGIAYALNKVMEQAKSDGYSWVVTMDQDSLLPEGLINAYRDTIVKYQNIGILCPQVIDRRRPYILAQNNVDIIEVDTCITSASCTSIEVWEQVGKFDEWLFIDLVDDEYCKRLRLNNYKILKLNAYVLDQQFGNVIPKELKKQKFWLRMSRITHITKFQHLTYKSIVSPLRVYYTNRNVIYLNRKYKDYKFTFYYVYNCKNWFQFMIWYSFTRWLLSDKKIKVMKAIICGMIDGKRKTVIPYVKNSI